MKEHNLILKKQIEDLRAHGHKKMSNFRNDENFWN